MSKLKKGKDDTIRDEEKLLKIKLFVTIFGTLVLISPYGNLLLGILNEHNSSLLTPALLTFPTLIILCFQWFWYICSVKQYRRFLKEINDKNIRD